MMSYFHKDAPCSQTLGSAKIKSKHLSKFNFLTQFFLQNHGTSAKYVVGLGTNAIN